jgi:hypothetical protein
MGLTNREPGFDQIEVKSGRTALDVRALSPGQTIELDTPQGAFTIESPGYYRLDVSDSDSTFATHNGGRARMTSITGSVTTLGPDEQVVVGGGLDDVVTSAASDLDAWDRWNIDRTADVIESPSTRYVSQEVYGVNDLDRYGTWRTESQYGPVWYPSGVAADWAPYSAGRWVWDPYYGWSWVDAAPWGWAPSHYGRWVHVSGYWGWAPGPIVAAPVYAPAVVAFFGGSNFSIGIGIGAPAVGWVALGWGEPIVPWWGGVGFVGVPWWGGWGGPWVINNVVIHDHHHRYYAHDIHDYCHSRERHALRFDREDRFGRGRHNRNDWREVRRDQLQPVHGRLRARPTAASLSPGEGRASRPPDRVRQRQVVATRAGRDNTQRLRDAGLRVPDRERSQPRIVGSRDQGRSPADTRERPSLRTRNRELGSVDQGGQRQRDIRNQPGSENLRGREANVPDRMRQRRPQVPSSPSGNERNVERRPPSGERRSSSNPRAERQQPPVPRADRPSLRTRPKADSPDVNDAARRPRANAPSERPAVSSPERARPQRPDVQAPRDQQPARRQRPHAPESQLQQPQQRRSGRVAEVEPREMPQPRQMRERAVAPREMPAAQPRQMRERAVAPRQPAAQPRQMRERAAAPRQPAAQPRQMRERSGQPRGGGQSVQSAPSGGARRDGAEMRGASRDSSSAPAQRDSGSAPAQRGSSQRPSRAHR